MDFPTPTSIYLNKVHELRKKSNFLSGTTAIIESFLFGNGHHNSRDIADIIGQLIISRISNIEVENAQIESEAKSIIDMFEHQLNVTMVTAFNPAIDVVGAMETRYHIQLDTISPCPVLDVFKLMSFYMKVGYILANKYNGKTLDNQPSWRIPVKFAQHIARRTALAITAKYMENVFKNKHWDDIWEDVHILDACEKCTKNEFENKYNCQEYCHLSETFSQLNSTLQ